MAATIDSDTLKVLEWLSPNEDQQNVENTLRVDDAGQLVNCYVKGKDEDYFRAQETLKALHRVFDNEDFYKKFPNRKNTHKIVTIDDLTIAREKITGLLGRLSDCDYRAHATGIIYKIGIIAGRAWAKKGNNSETTDPLTGDLEKNTMKVLDWIFPNKDQWVAESTLRVDDEGLLKNTRGPNNFHAIKDEGAQVRHCKNCREANKTKDIVLQIFFNRNFHQEVLRRGQDIDAIAKAVEKSENFLMGLGDCFCSVHITEIIFDIGVMAGRVQIESENKSEASDSQSV